MEDTITKEKVLSWLQDAVLDGLGSSRWDDAVEYEICTLFPRELEDKIDYRSGASKGVIIFDDWDWVVKIPFTEGEAGYYSYDESKILYGASNGVNDWDYCLREAQLYKKAVAAGIEDAFLETKLLGTTLLGFPIYIQKKSEDSARPFVIKNLATEDDNKSLKTLSSENKIPTYFLPENTLALIKGFGYNQVKKIFDFIATHGINDLSTNNCGVCNGKLVFMDYCGYYGE